MNDRTLATIFCGDIISIDGIVGEVVFSAIANSYSPDFPKTNWDGSDYRGIMIRQENGALIFHHTQ